MTTPSPMTDPAPALAPVDVAFDDPAGNEDEQMLRASVPAFRDLRRMLPASRLRMQMELAAFAASLPKGFTEGTEVDLSTFDADTAEAVADFFEKMQDMVLDNAADRDAMIEWLIGADDSTAALQVAFSVLSESLGN